MTKTFPLRIDENTHRKLKMLAAKNNTYVNTLILESIILLFYKYQTNVDDVEVDFDESEKYSVNNE